MSNFRDYFSQSAERYAAFRPNYPDGLFQWLAANASDSSLAWDCGCGSGQASLHLARHFDCVVATDASEEQIAHGRRGSRVHYAVAAAEKAALRSGSANLITVAQALHWFNLTSFYGEVKRILAPGGILAIWTYGLLEVSPEVDALMRNFYTAGVGAFWPAERALVDAGYRTIAFPFRELVVPRLSMEADWSLEQLEGYIGTWSAVMRFTAATGTNPVPAFMESVRLAWGPPDVPRHVAWPLDIRAGVLETT